MSDPCQFVCAELAGGMTVCDFPSVAGAGPDARCEKHYPIYLSEQARADRLEIISLLEQILAKP